MLSISLFCGADMKSTSGYVLALTGPSSLALLSWGSKRQSVVSRSTTESEFMSLSSSLFSEALPTLHVWQTLIPSIRLAIFEDNFASPRDTQLSFITSCEVVNGSEDIDISHIDTSMQRGGVLAKGLSCQNWPAALKLLQYATKPLPSYVPGKD